LVAVAERNVLAHEKKLVGWIRHPRATAGVHYFFRFGHPAAKGSGPAARPVHQLAI